MTNRRRAGVLLPIFSLPGRWGIGSFSRHARQFVRQLADAEQSIWQILPLGPTGYADSPYQSFSTFAGNPHFIDLDVLVADGQLTRAELDELDWGTNATQIDYGALHRSRPAALRLAYGRAGDFTADPSYQEFSAATAGWLDEYALFMTIKQLADGRPWTQWPTELRDRQPQALARVRDQHATELDYYRWTQWQFASQWRVLHAYAQQHQVQILGDVPIYVAMDSADIWTHPELFALAADGTPIEVAGVPPDGFSEGGQLWGNPLYDWDVHRETGFSWWIERLQHQFDSLDMVRLDHFRGLESYWAVPYGDLDARGGQWRPGPGVEFFRAINAAIGELPMVAEDLGYLTEAVHELRAASGLPGMQIIQFAFDSRERGDYRPHNYGRNTVVYTGTHDNPTLVEWFESLSAPDRRMAYEYLNNWWTPDAQRHWDYIALAMRSVASTAIVPMPDYLGLGAEARINTPSIPHDNWRWRMAADAFTASLGERMARLTTLVERSRP